MKRYVHLFLVILVLAMGLIWMPKTAYATNLSADNSLDVLKISGAELSPEFYYSTVNYTASVPYEVTEVEVTARASHPKATIDAITGYENLSVGENKIKITVTAENGNKAVYTVKLTRLEEGASGTATDTTTVVEEETPQENADATGENEIQEETVEPIKVDLHYGELLLSVYAAPEELVKDYMVYTPIDMDGIEIPAYRYEEGMVVKEVDDSDLYLVYGDCNTGDIGWFEYDSRTGVFQRYAERFVIEKVENTEQETVTEDVVASSEYADLLTKYNTIANEAKQLKQKIRMMTYVFLFIVVILLIIIFSIMWSKREDDYEDGDVFEEEPRSWKSDKKEKEIEIIGEDQEKIDLPKKAKLVETVKAVEPVLPTEEPLVNEGAEKDTKEEMKEEQEASVKNSKKHASILAYLGLDDDVPFDEEDETDEDESAAVDKNEEEDAPDAEMVGESEDFEVSEEEEIEETEVPKTKKKGRSLFGKKKTDEESTENSDIEFIDL